MPNVATIIDGIRLEQGTMITLRRSRAERAGDRRLLMKRSLFERNGDVNSRFRADHAGDMAAAAGVIGEHDVSSAEALDRAVTGLDLYFAGQRNNVLASRRRMKIVQMIRWRPPEIDTCGGFGF